MKRIGIFGGTFDPVHNSHVALVRAAIKELGLDKLYVVPTFSPPHKDGATASEEDRLNMLALAFYGEEKVSISDYELKRGGVSYTYLTAEHFKSVYGGEIFFLVGADMLSDFKTWKNPERILAACTLAAVKREGFSVGEENALHADFVKRYGKDYVSLPFTGENVSSTKIRVYSFLGLSLKGLVPERVEKYIKEKNVYAGDEITDYLKKNLPEKRRIHTACVAAAAVGKAKELGLKRSKVLTAALLHDCAKYLNPAEFKGFTLPAGVPAPVVHQYLGAYVAENVLGVKDEEILGAIRFHTSGKPDMTTLEKLIFVADMVEEGRNYEGVDELRFLFKKDFNECFKQCLKEETLHLMRRGGPIYSLTLDAYDYYVNGNDKNYKGDKQ